MATAQEPKPASWPALGTKLLERSVEIVDLTRPIYEGMPQWFGHQKTFIMRNQSHDEFKEIWKTSCGFEAHNLLISEHCGTHTDAIFEYDDAGPHLDESPLAFWYGPAFCLDVSAVRYPDYFTSDVLEAALAASGLEIRSGDIGLLHTGHGDRVFPTRTYCEQYPGLSRDGAEWLAKKGVVNIGVDNLSIDHSDDGEFSAHMVCKEFGIVNTESLTNLDKVANKRFFFIGLPLNIREGTGSPIRAIALLGDASSLPM
jgi:kynurenine formamidase